MSNGLIKDKNRLFILFFAIFLSFSIFFLCSCENSTQLQCATISEITAVGSKNYAVRINFLNDKRVEEKYVDVQIKCNKTCSLTFWEENQDKMTLNIDDYDEWFSLTTLICEASDKVGEENFEKFKDATGKTYLFNYDGNLEITLRVVVGDVEDNSSGTGQILVGSEPISDQKTLKIK